MNLSIFARKKHREFLQVRQVDYGTSLLGHCNNAFIAFAHDGCASCFNVMSWSLTSYDPLHMLKDSCHRSWHSPQLWIVSIGISLLFVVSRMQARQLLCLRPQLLCGVSRLAGGSSAGGPACAHHQEVALVLPGRHYHQHNARACRLCGHTRRGPHGCHPACWHSGCDHLAVLV